MQPQQVLQEMLDRLGVKTKVEQSSQDGQILLQITTADPARLIGRQGQTLNQLQFLLNRILLRHEEQAPRVIVDCERYRQRERDEVLEAARAAADRVRRWGEPETIGPFSAVERHLICRQLASDAELEASAEGGADDAPQKIRIRVKPAPAATARPATPSHC